MKKYCENSLGIYIHIPFCKNKCPYCDFYSIKTDNNSHINELIDNFMAKTLSWIEYYSHLCTDRIVDTIYFGGGTPTLVGSNNIDTIIKKIMEKFIVAPDCEITVEANPTSAIEETIKGLANTKVNRISFGMQSANENESRLLGRKHTNIDVENCVKWSKKYGIDNISIDLMLAVEGQNIKSLKNSIDFIEKLNVNHISAYLLKIEKGTKFYQMRDKMVLPNEDEECDLYMFACNELEKIGYKQYEISNFCKNNMYSRHNVRYWDCQEYIGIGPSAHSFFDGKRFYFNRSLKDFINGDFPANDGDGGNFEEYAMLRLRLNEGLCQKDVIKRYGHPISDDIFKKAKILEKNGLVNVNNETISITRKGFLVSNSIICEILY